MKLSIIVVMYQALEGEDTKNVYYLVFNIGTNTHYQNNSYLLSFANRLRIYTVYP